MAPHFKIQHKEEEPKDHQKEMKHHKHLERLAKTGVVVAGAYAMHEKHKAKKEGEKHKVREEVAATIAVGAAGFAFHEHHKVKEHNKILKKEKHHH